MKRKSPKEFIEETSNPELEHSFIKYPGKEPEEVSWIKDKNFVLNNFLKKMKIFYKNGRKPYTQIHTHPSKAPGDVYFPLYFSTNDLRDFALDKNAKTTVIAVREPDTGTVQGYNVLTKGNEWKGLKKELKNLKKELNTVRDKEKCMDDFLERYPVNQKIVPAKGYKVVGSGFAFEKEKDSKGLESKIKATVSISFLIASIFFLSSNITGNVISNYASQSNLIGMILFAVGLISTFFYLKRR